MTPSQYVTLSLLAVQDQSSADLARKTGVTPQSMSEIIGMLERKFLIARVENPEHRRILTIHLTDQGLDVLRQCDKRARALEDKLLKGLGAAQIEALRNALDLIARNGHGY
jgi:DNA-binding MarR family transcriptional regulator